MLISHCYMRRYKIVRGALDLGGVAGRTISRSKYGGRLASLQIAIASIADGHATAKQPKA